LVMVEAVVGDAVPRLEVVAAASEGGALEIQVARLAQGALGAFDTAAIHVRLVAVFDAVVARVWRLSAG
jgi:hypothetical protein